jgi:hypothetical protein
MKTNTTNEVSKETLKFILKTWPTSMTKGEILKETGIRVGTFNSLIYKLKKAGFNMPKKSRSGYLNILIDELIKEEGLNK